MKSKFLIAAIFSLLTFGASAQSELKVATGECTKDSCSTYVSMFRELRKACAVEGLTLTEVQSKGSVESVDRLLNNEINAAIAQTDVLFWRRRTEDLSNIKTLIALHPEEVHFVAPSTSGLKADGEGMLGRFKKTDVVFTTVDQLAGYKVGAVNNSGSYVTARLIRSEGNVAYEVVTFPSTDALLNAVTAGEVQAAVFVGGAPLPAVANLGSNFKLLSFSDALRSTLKDIYRPAVLNYAKMNAAGIKSLATEANLVTREYKMAKMVTPLAAFRACALNGAIAELKETTGTHRKWQAVDPASHGKWSWYELPEAVEKADPKAKLK